MCMCVCVCVFFFHNCSPSFYHSASLCRLGYCSDAIYSGASKKIRRSEVGIKIRPHRIGKKRAFQSRRCCCCSLLPEGWYSVRSANHHGRSWLQISYSVGTAMLPACDCRLRTTLLHSSLRPCTRESMRALYQSNREIKQNKNEGARI